MKRPILKRTVKTIEVVTWTLEYEDVAESSPPPPSASSSPPSSDESPPSQEILPPQTSPPLDKLGNT